RPRPRRLLRVAPVSLGSDPGYRRCDGVGPCAHRRPAARGRGREVVLDKLRAENPESRITRARRSRLVARFSILGFLLIAVVSRHVFAQSDPGKADLDRLQGRISTLK